MHSSPRHHRFVELWVLRALWLFILSPCLLQSAEVDVSKGIEFAVVDKQSLKLDLYRPTNVSISRLVVWVHGGAWRGGSRDSMPLTALLKHGYAIASLDYRLTPTAPFPAQVHDIKAAIRFLRGNANHFKINTDTITIAGASAGGHLVALVGTTNEHAQLEGNVGQHLDQSSSVQAIVSYYGASNLTSILAQSTPHGLSVRIPALQLLLGGQPETKPKLAQLASPVFHIDKNDPPLLLLHGDQDPQMPINQSHELHGRYLEAGLDGRLEVIHGAAHGGKPFYNRKNTMAVLGFLENVYSD
ncbi:MAG: alpha/beta hydrolase [Verrucomicrobia bacterium]|nr:alpha/beta hydrolase [Verrucomicrobiota bacterium]